MNLPGTLANVARRQPSATALYWGGTQFTYADIWARTLWVAEQLRAEFGVRPGDRVALWLKNCPEFVPALFGILQAGAVAVPINNFLKVPEVNFILADGGIDLIILDDSMLGDFEKLREARPNLRALRVEKIGTLADSTEGCPRLESDIAVIIYTSGTTGHPKGAMLSHGNLLQNVESSRVALEASENDRVVVLLPMFHSFMLTVGVVLPLLVGASLVLIKTLHPPKNIMVEILQNRGTILPAVPQFFRAMASGPVPPNLPLRVCISGGAPLPGELLKEFTAKFPVPLLEGYGLSEASPVVSFNPLRGPWKAGSIGVPLSGVEVSAQDASGKILPPGEIGEICVRGGNVMLGYWNQPEETEKTLRNGWLLTGDIGYGDGDGYFYITDRKKDMLLVNGINVYPREIEEVIYAFPGVKEVAVIGIPDARRGEQPLAFIAPCEKADLAEAPILHFVRQQLADYKVPRQIVFMPALPRNATGKILKTELRKAAASNS